MAKATKKSDIYDLFLSTDQFDMASQRNKTAKMIYAN